MTAILDTRSESLTIQFKKGTTLDHIFWYYHQISKTSYQVINLEGCKARMQARLSHGSPVLTGFDLTTETGGLEIVTGVGETPLGAAINESWGIRIYVPDDVTSVIDWPKNTQNIIQAIYDIELVLTNKNVVDFLNGTLQAFPEVTM